MCMKIIILLLVQCMIDGRALGTLVSKREIVSHDCECIDVTMVCSFRDRSSFGTKDRCKGKTTHVLLNGNKIPSLQSNAFAGLAQMEWLVLAGNNLTTLPKDLLKENGNLRNLLLNKNQIQSLPAGIFAELNKLRNIDLSDNRLEKLPAGIFAGLRSIKSIILRKNALSSLERNLFRGLKSLEILDMSHNQLTALPRDVFRGLSSLKSLALSSNRLSTIGGEDVKGLCSLESLRADDNLLSALPPFGASWPAVDAAFHLGGNRFGDVNADALRSWLAADGRRRLLVLSAPPLLSPRSLRWAVSDATVEAVVGGACHCGGIRRGSAEIRFCVEVRCGGKGEPKDWVAAVSSRRH